MANYIVYTFTLNDGNWYYGTYDHDTANEVAYELGSGNGIWHCVCKAEEAEDYKVQNLPLSWHATYKG